MANTLTLPGFVDVHTHLREPSTNDVETIANGTRAAMIGGFVLICDMPNNPGNPTWSEEKLDEKIAIAARDAHIPTDFYAGAQPESDNIGELAGMARKAVGLKLYGAPTTGNERDYEAKDFEEIVQEWHRVAPDKPILLHAGRDNLSDMITLVADINDHPLHICHVNDPYEVRQVQAAKQNELDVTCGVCPHHLFKTSHDVKSQGWFARMQPPLARQIESEELWYMLANGQIDIIETDYAPHSVNAKMDAEHENPSGIHDPHHRTCFGVPGIEHVGPMLLRQAQLGTIAMDRLIEALVDNPLRMLRMDGPSSEVTWSMEHFVISQDDVASGAGWTPYLGAVGVGRVIKSVINGRNVYERQNS